MLDQKGTILEGVRAKDIGPSDEAFCGNNDPEVFEWMVDDQDIFVLGGTDVPSSAEELDGVGGTDAAGNMQGQMQIEEFWVGGRSQAGTFFCEGFVPCLVWGEAGGAVLVGSIVVSDFGGQELVGLFIGSDFFVRKEGH